MHHFSRQIFTHVPNCSLHNLIHLIQSQQLCIFVHNSETLCYFRESFRPVVHNGGLKDFLMPMLITLYYYYISMLYWPRQKNIQEMDLEQWNNAAHRHGQQAHKRSHATHGRKGASTFGNGG